MVVLREPTASIVFLISLFLCHSHYVQATELMTSLSYVPGTRMNSMTYVSRVCSFLCAFSSSQLHQPPWLADSESLLLSLSLASALHLKCYISSLSRIPLLALAKPCRCCFLLPSVITTCSRGIKCLQGGQSPNVASSLNPSTRTQGGAAYHPVM